MHTFFRLLIWFGRAASYGVWPTDDEPGPPRRRIRVYGMRAIGREQPNNDCLIWF